MEWCVWLNHFWPTEVYGTDEWAIPGCRLIDITRVTLLVLAYVWGLGKLPKLSFKVWMYNKVIFYVNLIAFYSMFCIEKKVMIKMTKVIPCSYHHIRSNSNYTLLKWSSFIAYASSTFSLKRPLFSENCFLSSLAVLGSVLQMGLISDRPHTILKGGWGLFLWRS